MLSPDRVVQHTATVEQRVEAIQAALDERGMNATDAVEEDSTCVTDRDFPPAGPKIIHPRLAVSRTATAIRSVFMDFRERRNDWVNHCSE